MRPSCVFPGRYSSNFGKTRCSAEFGAWLRRPVRVGFRTYPDGLGALPIRFPCRPPRHQRPLPALAARGLDGPDGHVELAVGHLLDPQRVEQRAAVVAERRQQHVDGAHAAQRRPGLGVQVRHQHGAVPAAEPVEAYPAPLGQYLAQLDAVALAAALLLGLARVAVEDRAAPGGRVERGALDPRAVGELGAVVGQEQGEQPSERLRRRPLQHVERRSRRRRRLVGHGQRDLEPERPRVQCEQAPAVGLEPYHRVRLAGGGAFFPRQFHERGERAGRAVRRPPWRLGARARLVAAPAPQLEAAHPRVAAPYPPVYGRRRRPDLGRPGQRYLLGRQPPRDVVPDQIHDALELRLAPVDAHPRFAQLGVGESLRPGGRVLAPPPSRAVVPAEPAPVAAMRPRQQLRAGVVGGLRGAEALVRAAAHRAVARHLVGDRRRRPAQLPGHLPARLALVQAPLDRGALRPVEPAVRLGRVLPHALSFLSGGPSALAP